MPNYVTCVLYNTAQDCTTAMNEAVAGGSIGGIDVSGLYIATVGRVLVFGNDEEDELYAIAKHFHSEGSGNGYIGTPTPTWSDQCMHLFVSNCIKEGFETVGQS